MKKLVLTLTVLFIFSCSSNLEEPQMDSQQSQQEEEVIKEEETPELEEINTIPFNISIVFRTYNNAPSGGEYYILDFLSGNEEPSELLNITESEGLSTEIGLVKNSAEDILVFNHTQSIGTNVEDRFYTSYDLNITEATSGSFADFFPNIDACFFNVNSVLWNRDKIFTYENDICDTYGAIRIQALDIATGQVYEFPILENAYAGDSAHRSLMTKKYFIIQYDDRKPETLNSIKEGLIVYDANTYEEVLHLNSMQSKGIIIDGDQLYVATQPNTIEIIDLKSGNPLYTNTTNTFIVDWASSIIKGSISDGKVAGVRAEAIDVPVYYDITQNQTIDVNRDSYFAFFNQDAFDNSADIIVPQEFKFDMASGTFAITYYTFDPGATVLKSIGLVFMDFEANVLYQHDLPQYPIIPDRILKR